MDVLLLRTLQTLFSSQPKQSIHPLCIQMLSPDICSLIPLLILLLKCMSAFCNDVLSTAVRACVAVSYSQGLQAFQCLV